MRTHFGAGIITIAALVGPGSGARPALAASGEVEVRALSSRAAATEQFDRDVDRVALSAQDSAISTLSRLLQKYRGTRQEPILLAKLADLQQQKAAIVFRISMGLSRGRARPGAAKSDDLKRYRQAMRQSISTLDALIAKYPGFPELAHSYFLRGKAYEEIGKKDMATRDYLYLVNHYPTVEETSPAYMSLADFAIDANDHPLAIKYLRRLEERPEDPHYPFALYKLAWSYYNIKDIGHALEYAERQVRYYDDRAKANPDTGRLDPDDVLTSDGALRENTLLDIPVFYFEGVEEKQAAYPVDGALEYFQKIEPGPTLGKMALRFAKLLRSRDMDEDLLAWKTRFLASHSELPESLDIVTLTFEHQLNERKYAQLVDTSHDVVALYRANSTKKRKWDGFAKAQTLILDTAEGLQALIIKNKNADQARPLSLTLAALYQSFTQIVRNDDPRIPQVHYNLAETLFMIKDYAGATEHYRWVVEHLKGADKAVARSVADAAIKAIAARYEILRDRKIIPAEAKAVAAPRDLGRFPSPRLDPQLADWVKWIDERVGDSDTEEARRATDNFVFEANRTLYAQGDLGRAITRLESFARERSASPYAIPSASLALDSFIAASDWDRAFQLASDFMKVKEWKDGPFAKRLFQVASDSLYKKIEAKYQAKLYADTLKDADSFVSRYPVSERIPDCLSLAGSAALAIGDRDRAMGYFSRLIQDGQAGGHLGEALLARARIEEGRYGFQAAASDYRAFLSLPPGGAKLSEEELTALRRKTLALTWISGSAPELKALASSKTICARGLAPDLDEECDKYRALAALAASGDDPSEDAVDQAFDHLRKLGGGEAKTIWAVYALKGARHLAFRDRNLALRAIGSGYRDLDPTVKYELLSYVSDLVPRAFRMNRLAMKDVAPLRASEKYITHRVDVIREMENAAAKIMELPWARVRAETMNEIASLYLDLARGLQDLPAPKELSASDLASYQDTIRKLVVPFEEKGQDIRSKAWDIASRFSVENATFQEIAEPFFADNPSQARKLKAQAAASRAPDLLPKGISYVPLGAAYLPELDGAGGPKPAAYIAWEQALKDRNRVKVAFFMQEIKEKKLLPDSEQGLIRAISLADAGARGEGMLELAEARGSLEPRLNAIATLTLARDWAETYAFDKARPLYRELVPPPVADPGPKGPAVAESQEGSRKPAVQATTQ